jgi:hypothetical protein
VFLTNLPSNLAQHKVGRGSTVFSDVSEVNNGAEAAGAEEITDITVGSDF